jgi:hypothetical protein
MATERYPERLGRIPETGSSKERDGKAEELERAEQRIKTPAGELHLPRMLGPHRNLSSRVGLPVSNTIGRCCFGCFAHQLRPRREIDHALRIGLGPRGIAEAPLYVQQG